MKESYLFDMTFNNIVFKGRNKAYGAYKLRRVYHRHIIIAAIVAIVIFSGGLISPIVNNMFFVAPEKYVKPVYDIIEPVTIVLPPPPVEKQQEILPPVMPAKVEVATEVYAKTKVVPDNTPVKEVELANQEDLKNADFGTKKKEGIDPADLPPIVPSDDLIGIDDGIGTATAPETSILDFAEEMPEYYGGLSAMSKYLGRKLNYPAAARSENIEGTVVVTFVVGRSGDIEDVKVLKGLGFGTDEEALRVIKSMPRWRPGKQNGMPVAVRYTLPIKFSLRN
ncbi:TonB family protein [Pontibacter sp. BT310]|uniref:TonB family protein n=2 Tax=Pontibacter TaxID=323449 RepID=A0ABS6XFQ3_9BACT|nr:MULTISPECIES: energy transducer TonB [Pontibacter]MBJ6119884.1 TonB family protein [Pontibacter sp. BT310]MBR0572313.1 TonB family protein [Microvirga sp. STS03]MBW3366737.1 TonB family protein [Pontibacter populi]